MKFEIIESPENLDADTLIPIWTDSLPDLDERRITWSYRQHPHGRPRIWLLHDTESGQAFGSCLVVPRWVHHGGKRLRGGITGDFAIKKDYRTMGPALKLQRAIVNSSDFDMLIAFPNRNSVGVQLRAGFQDLGELTVFRRIFRSGPVLKRRYNPLLSSLASPFVDLGIRLRSLRFGRGSSIGHSVTHELDGEFTGLGSRVENRLAWAGSRDMDYLVWRFVEHPYKSYRFFGLQETGSAKLLGYLAYYVKDNIAYIDDFLVEEPRTDLRPLLDAFGAYCRRSRLDAMSLIMLENATYARLFRELGFFAEKTQQKVLLAHRAEDPIGPDDVFITMGDCDI
jgi:hypothetical protein